VTLSAATLEVVHVPHPPVEAVIALSIAFVAAEIVRMDRGLEGITVRAPWMVARVAAVSGVTVECLWAGRKTVAERQGYERDRGG
jgi:hypothetical protein